MTTAIRPPYWSLLRLFFSFIAGPALVELAIYLTRPELFPAYLPLQTKLLSLPLAFIYYCILPLASAVLLALIQRLLPNTKILLILVTFQFGLFYAISLSRLVPTESGFTLTRIIVFLLATIGSLACGWCLYKWSVTNVRLWISITIYFATAAFLLQHLFRIPFAFWVVLILYPVLILGLAYFPGKVLIGIVVFIGVFFFQTKTMLQPFAPPIKQEPYDRVIVVGIDAFSPDTIQELRQMKKLPTIETLFANGTHGRLRTLNLPFSPLVWNTIYTGVAPKLHGVTGFTYSRPAGAEPFLSLWLDNWTNSDWSHKWIRTLQDGHLLQTLRPANSRSRLAPPIWDLVNTNGGSALVIGGWTTYPPEKIHGTLIADYAFSAMPGTIGVYYPISKQIDELMTFQPSAGDWPSDLQRYITRDLKVHNVAMNLLKESDQKFVFSYYSSPDAFGHHYGTRIGMNNTSEQSRKQYLDWQDNIYQMMDGFLKDYLALIDDRTLLIVCSDHGFHYDKRQHNYEVDGAVMIYGKGVRKNIEIQSDVFTIAPTVLYALGMPRSQMFEAMPLKQAFEGSIPEPAAKQYRYHPEFFEVANQGELEEDKLRELEDLQYINR